MLHPTGTAQGALPGSSSQAYVGAPRDAPHDLQRARGHTVTGAGTSETTRPVAGPVASGHAARARNRMSDDAGAPTGPRPTFERTPLEKLRSDTFRPATATPETDSAPPEVEAGPMTGTAQTDATVADAPIRTRDTPYGEIPAAHGNPAPDRQLDMTI